jgi:hypothetical protein
MAIILTCDIHSWHDIICVWLSSTQQSVKKIPLLINKCNPSLLSMDYQIHKTWLQTNND